MTQIANSRMSPAITGEGPVLSPALHGRTFTKVGNQTIHTGTYESWSQLEECIAGWNAILRENRSLSIFCTPEWMGSWWKAFGANKRMIALAFLTESNTLSALVPLYFDEIRTPLSKKLTVLRLIGDGSGDSDGLDLIARPGFELACAQALLNWLAERSDWDVCSLNTVKSGSFAVKGLSQALKRVNWPFVLKTRPNSAVCLPRSWSQYVDRLSPSFRPLVTRYPRKLAKHYQVRIHRCEDVHDLEKGLEILFSLHTKRWNLVNEPGSFGSQERTEFYQQMAEGFLCKGWLELWFLELNGAVAAAQFCFRYGDTVSILQEGFDPKFVADKVGYALRAAMLKHFIETGVKHYDFLGGIAAHKQSWGAEPGEYLHLDFARPRSPGSIYLSCRTTLAKSKEWLRARLPCSAWNILHEMNIRFKNSPSDPVSDQRSFPASTTMRRSQG